MKLYIYKQSADSSFVSLAESVSSYFLQKSNLFYQAAPSEAHSAELLGVCLLLCCFAILHPQTTIFLINNVHFYLMKKNRPKKTTQAMQWENESILILPVEQRVTGHTFLDTSRTGISITMAHTLQTTN